MSSEAKRKVAAWRAVAGDADAVKLHESISLSVPPSAIGATFPGLTPFRTLRSEDILTQIVRLPSVHVTAYASLLLGVVITFALVGARPQTPPSPARLSCCSLLVIGFVRLIRSRLPAVKLIPNSMDVSSSPRGPCRVVNDVLSITNSHAGTHADMPTHFCPSVDAAPFEDDHYTGDAFIVDISHLLRGDKTAPKPITAQIVETVLSYLPVESDVWRLLFVSRRGSGHSDDVWEGGFAYFEPEAVQLLAEKCPSLLLVGTDAPSVDHPEEAPICEAAHGELYKNGIAILENLQFKNVYSSLENVRVVRGGLLTIFNPTQSFEDSRGCSVFFFPSHAR